MSYSGSYNYVTIDNIVAQARSLLRIDNMESGDEMWLMDLVKGYLNKARNNETVVPHVCSFKVCDRKVVLPVKVSNIIGLKVFDSTDTQMSTRYMLRDYPASNRMNMAGVYDQYGHTIEFYTNDYDDYRVEITFMDLLRDESTGEHILPEDYSMPVAKLAAHDWLVSYPNSMNAMTANRYQSEAINELARLRGDANKSTPNQDSAYNSLVRPTPARTVSYIYGNTYCYNNAV